jgi:hypothetical protein
MVAFFQNRHGLLVLDGLLGEDRTEQTAADDDVVV